MITLDEFAKAAMQALVSGRIPGEHYDFTSKKGQEELAKLSFEIAEAMVYRRHSYTETTINQL